ncbi:polysaccharide biosynthesis/export family protein [Rhizobium gallicum]|uniref:polysaccharide biosynthesis/export family protein n=1 Tax=Rhizobium gallicum TaxID=56730 RepID=UPI001EF96AB9|nr:polysaccharide biosynthesis/export family protein [Rhizobium gallicum]ULJ75092.1 polysaccharide biosynthesis/export family protein [Rhizobium gallicum]
MSARHLMQGGSFSNGRNAFSWIMCGAAAMFIAAAADTRAEVYRLQAGDVVKFDFLDDAELPVRSTIDAEGEAQFPLVGGVEIGGLTVRQALEKLGAEYKNRQILVDPKIALSIASYKPVFVLGEVKNPGSFPYYPGLTVEQALGLAGGTLTAAWNASDRILTRARLRGTMDGAEVEIVHEAIYAARLVAQLHGSETIDIKDAPESARPYLERASLKGVLEIEDKILKTDLITTKAQVEILTQGIAETEAGLKILAQLEIEQKDVVAMNERDLERVTDLRKRELNTETDLARVKNTTANEKSQLLGIYAEMSRSRRELGNLKLELAKLKADRQNDILLKLQERAVAIKKLESTRQSAEEQFYLIASVTADEKKREQISFTYEVRRPKMGSIP